MSGAMNKKQNLPKPLQMNNILQRADSNIWNKLKNEDGRISALLCKKYTDEKYPGTAGMLFALANWRKHRVIYEFDKELAETLIEIDSVDDDIPCEAITQLPYNAAYIDVPKDLFYFIDNPIPVLGFMNNEKIYVSGFFFTIDSGENYKKVFGKKTMSIATFDITFTNEHMMTIAMPLSTEFSLKQGLEYMGNDGYSHNHSMVRLCGQLLQLVLYLSATNADIQENEAQKELREKAERKIAKSQQNDKPNNDFKLVSNTKVNYQNLRKWEVGFRYGSIVRQKKRQERKEKFQPNQDGSEKQLTRQGSHSRKRTHARRGHFHHFWTGSKAGKRQLVLKWVSPIIVNSEFENIATIHRVK